MLRIVKPVRYSSFSFERDSIAYYYNEDGILTEAAVDELREGYDPETLEFVGPIIEDEATNKLLYSNEFENAVWEKVGTPSPVVTDGYATGPDGTMSAALVEVASSGTQAVRQETPFPVFIGNIIFSVYLKAVVPDTSVRITIPSTSGGWTSVFRINVGDYAAFESNASIKPLPDGWFRCEIHGPYYTLSPAGYSTIQALSNDDFLVSNAMFEIRTGDGPYNASSYFPSEGTEGTRAADVQTTPPAVISSNVPEDDNPEYNPATAYNFEQVVMVTDGYHRNYRSRVAGSGTNTGNFPPDSPNEWLDIGATNRWRVFDYAVGADLQTENDDLIDFTVSVSPAADAVLLFNAIGETARVTVYYQGAVEYQEEKPLIADPLPSNWYSYFFGIREPIGNVAFLNLPPAFPANIRVEIIGDGPVALGKAVIGTAYRLGLPEWGSTGMGIQDFSTKEFDGFGNPYIQERRFLDTVNVRPVVDPGAENSVKRTLSTLRATICGCAIDTRFDPIIVLGFPRDFEVLFTTPAGSHCSLQIEGV